MTGHPAVTPTGGGRRRAADVLRGLGALVVLLALLIGLPALLYTVAGAPVPHRVPSPGQLTDILTRRDNGQLFVAGLLVLAWAGWGAFAASVAVETLAQLRGRGAPRLPALGGAQRLAGHLVAAVVVAFLGAGPALRATVPVHGSTALLPGSPVAVMRLQLPSSADLPAPVSPAPTGGPSLEPPAAPTLRPAKAYVVQRGDTLWGVAEVHLGDAERYTEIARLNYGRPQPDGRALTDAHWIYPGWTLLLPADATGLPVPAAPDSAGSTTSAPPEQGDAPAAGHRRPPADTPATSSPTQPPATPTPTPTPTSRPTPNPTPTAPRPSPATSTSRPPTGQPTGGAEHAGGTEHADGADHSDGATVPGWEDAPLISAAVASGLATALTVLRLRRRRGYRPSPPAPAATGPQPAPRLRRLAAARPGGDGRADSAPPAAHGQRATDAGVRRLSEVQIGRRDDGPVTLDLLDHPGLAVTGPGADTVLRSLLADLLARARRYELQILLDPPAAERLVRDIGPVSDLLQRTTDAAAALMEAEIACVGRSRRLTEAGAADYADYRTACSDDPLPLLVLILAAPIAAADQLTALLTVGRRLGVTALILGRHPTGMAGLRVAAGGQLVATEPPSLASQLQGAQLVGLPAEDAAEALSTLAQAVPGELPPPTPDTFDSHEAFTDTSVDPAPTIRTQPEEDRSGAEIAPEGPRQPPIRVQLLGPIRITAWGEEIATGLRATARELLTYYVLRPDGATAEAAIDALWPDAAPERGRQRFWTALGNLRSRLRGPTGNPEIQIIAKYGAHYRADPDLLEVDLWRFQAALTDAGQAHGDPTAEAAALQGAIDAYRGDLAADADYLWAEAAREDLHRRALDALVRLADLHHDQPRPAIADLDRALALDPYAEEIYRRLIGLHTAAGRPDDARRAYRQLRDRLADLDLEPEPATTALIASIPERPRRPTPPARQPAPTADER